MRATPLSSGRHGRILKVEGSGIAIMSDSSIALNPVIDEPSNPIPPSKASSSSCALIEKLFSWPRMSVNHRRTKRMSRSSTKAFTSSAVCGWSAIGRAPSWRGLKSAADYSQELRPQLQGANGGLESLALGGEDVLDLDRCVVDHVSLDDPLRLQLLHPLRQQTVGEVGHQLLELGETGRPVQEDEQDRAGPALADKLDCLVVGRAAGLAAYDGGPLGRHERHRKPGRGPRQPGPAGSPRSSRRSARRPRA